MANIFNIQQSKAKNINKSDVFEIKKYIKKFKTENLTIGHDAQRDIDMNWVQEIMDNWNERACAPIAVVIENGQNLIVDGQHRFKAMEMLGYKQIECYVIDGILASEAFLMINNIKPIAAIDKFYQKAKIEKYEKSIKELFDSKDIDIAIYSEKNFFSDVSIFLDSEDKFNLIALDQTLSLLTELLEYEGKISKQLLLKTYHIFNDYPRSYDKIYKHITKLKLGYLNEEFNSKKMKNKLYKRFPKSKLDVLLLELI